MFKKISILPFVLIIKIYQKLISPILLPSCRFNPTCSQYSIQSLNKYGLLKGLWLTFKRISKCHPFGSSGYDPVP